MGYERRVVDGVVQTIVEGCMTVDGCVNSIRELDGFIADNRLYEMVIYRPGVTADLEFNHQTRIMREAIEMLSPLDHCAVAFVADLDFVYGMCRQLQLQIENDRILMSVFRTEATAWAWINEMRSYAQSALTQESTPIAD